MAKLYIHLSDIHFGQEKGGKIVIHNDVKERLIEDVSQFVSKQPNSKADGLIISGDIAYAGKKEEYKQAGDWLDRITTAAGCDITDIQMVPGNHDIDRDEISKASELVLKEIADKGEDILDEFLANDRDREMLYDRFTAYRPFAEAYDCPLDKDGGHAGDSKIELAPNRILRFIGLNTALICSKGDQEGKLLLGARQRVLPKTDGEELIVIGHHPLHWLQDSKDARRYLRSRARVFISGHEHILSVEVDSIDADTDLLMIASGATVPPDANEIYKYTYNIIEFDWDHDQDALCVTVHPRTWSEQNKIFEADATLLGGKEPRFTLGSPYFKRGSAIVHDQDNTEKATQSILRDKKKIVELETIKCSSMESATMPSKYPLLLLRFFRDLAPGQRMTILVKLGVLPDNWPESLTHTVERRLLDSLNKDGRLDDLEAAIDEIKNNHENEGENE